MINNYLNFGSPLRQDHHDAPQISNKQWWQKNMHDGFMFVMPLQSAYMWGTTVFIKKGAPKPNHPMHGCKWQTFPALKEASSRLCTHTYT
jgi:hypothetical protein